MEAQDVRRVILCDGALFCLYLRLSLLACYEKYHFDQIRLTGMPRNDLLASKNGSSTCDTILYAPTWRGKESATIFPFDDFDSQVLEDWLEKHDLKLIVRAHIVDNAVDAQAIRETSRIIMDNRSDAQNSLADRMQDTCALITDYSSIYIDYLLLDKPIIFVPYDLEDYLNERGFLHDYDSNTPGSKVTDFKTFLEALETAVKDPVAYEKERALVRERFHKYDDFKFSERVAACLEHDS